MSGTECDKCKGSGLVPREGVEIDTAIHPILSKHKTVCPDCGGSGRFSNEELSRRNREAAKKAQS